MFILQIPKYELVLSLKFSCPLQVLEREVGAVEQWRRSGTLLHIMRDHTSHITQLVPGNTWGIFQPASAATILAYVKRNIFKVPNTGDISSYYLSALKVGM